jgi:hypothetical protein
VDYLTFLQSLHERLRPAVYLEIGVDVGRSLSISQTRSVGIDPNPQVYDGAVLGKPWIKLYREDSDQFFASHTPDATLEGHPLDLVFIDGLHQFVQVVRDLEHVEQWSHTETVVVIHDVVPYNPEIGSRAYRDGDWTGDVWRIVPFLREHRPDLHCRLLDAAPTGVLVVTNLSPTPTHSGMAELAETLDRDFPNDGPAYEQLVSAWLVEAQPLSTEALVDSL